MIGTAVPSRAAKCLPAFFLAAFLLRLASQAAVVDGLVSYWPLDVSNGGITPDLSFSNQMIINGGATVVAGQFSNAFSFNGSSQYLINYHSTNNANSGLPIWRAGTYTVAMWVKGAAQANKYLFSEGNTNTTLPIFVIQTGLSDGSKLDVILRNNTGQNLISHVTSSGVVFDNTWHHIAWVDNLGSVKLYIDGTLDPASAALNFDYNRIEGTVTLNDTVIGCLVRTGVSTANIFNGLIDEVTVWERLLSPDEVNQVRTNGVYLSGQLISARPAIITSLPADAEAHVSDTQVFSVGASGNRPLTYQWLLDGTNLADNARITGS